MRNTGRTVAGIVLMLLAAALVVAGDAPLTNSDVTGMVNAGLVAGTIIAKIQGSSTDFQLDTASLAILTQRVIQAMIERQSPARSDVAAQAWPRDKARHIWSDLVRVINRCRSRGDLMLFDAGLQFSPIQDSSACVDTNTGFSVIWDQIDTICFKYLVIDEATVGVLMIRTKAGKSFQVRASQMAMQAADGEVKFQQPRLNYRCD